MTTKTNLTESQLETLTGLGAKLVRNGGPDRHWTFPKGRAFDRYVTLDADCLGGDGCGVRYIFESFEDALCWALTGYYDEDRTGTVDAGDDEYLAAMAEREGVR